MEGRNVSCRWRVAIGKLGRLGNFISLHTCNFCQVRLSKAKYSLYFNI